MRPSRFVLATAALLVCLASGGELHAQADSIDGRVDGDDWLIGFDVGGSVPALEMRRLAQDPMRFSIEGSLGRRVPLPYTFLEIGGGFSAGLLRNGGGNGDGLCPSGPPCLVESKQGLRAGHARLGLATSMLRGRWRLEAGGGATYVGLTAQRGKASELAGVTRWSSYDWRHGIGGYGRAFVGLAIGKRPASFALGVAGTVSMLVTDGETFEGRVSDEGEALGAAIALSLRVYF